MNRRDFLLGAPTASAAATLGLCLRAAAATEYRRGGMVYRRFGRTGMYVSLLSFGSHPDPADKVGLGPDREPVMVGTGKNALTQEGQARRDRLICRALDLGVNLFDVYEDESQWEPVARVVRGRRGKVLISLAIESGRADLERAYKLFGHVDLYRLQPTEQIVNHRIVENWDKCRKAKEAGKIRAIGVAAHTEPVMISALEELEGIDFVFFPYNFIHDRADYSRFLPLAIERGVGIMAMKPLASGSIMRLDPRARPGAKPEFEQMQMWQRGRRQILPEALAELTKSLDRMPDETLCMAAMRYVYSQPFLATAVTGMFQEQLLEDNYRALTRYWELRSEERVALDAARRVARLCEADWLPPHYRWLEEQWRV